MINSGKDVFDILGIESREDSYTDLICDLFENWNVFKRRFCEEFANCSETEVDAYKLTVVPCEFF
jgi:hypothetical protein